MSTAKKIILAVVAVIIVGFLVFAAISGSMTEIPPLSLTENQHSSAHLTEPSGHSSLP